MDLRLNDKLAIAEVVNNWAIWRDAGDWERFRTVWHADGWMTATWFQGPAEKFIEVSRAGFEKGVSILHFLGGTSVEVKGDRGDRADEDDDQPARRRRRRGRRRRVHRPLLRFLREARRPLGDRATPADLREGPDGPGEPEREARRSTRRSSARFPEGYRHLAYLQTKLGFTIKLDLPQLKGPVVEQLYAHGRAWLDGAPSAFPAA